MSSETLFPLDRQLFQSLQRLTSFARVRLPPAAVPVPTAEEKAGAPPCQTSPAEKEREMQIHARSENTAMSACQMSTTGKEGDLGALALSNRYGGEFEEGKGADACQISLAAKEG